MFQRMNETEIAQYVERVMTVWGIYLEESGAEFPAFELKELGQMKSRTITMQYQVRNRFETIKVYYSYGVDFETLTVHHIIYPVHTGIEEVKREVYFYSGQND